MAIAMNSVGGLFGLTRRSNQHGHRLQCQVVTVYARTRLPVGV